MLGGPRIAGSYDCSRTLIKNLEGAPVEVSGDFVCCDNRHLESLAGSPQRITGSFDCESTPKLISLDGGPRTVTGDFYCGGTALHSYRGIPDTVAGDLYCEWSPTVEVLAILRCKIGGKFFFTVEPGLWDSAKEVESIVKKSAGRPGLC